MIKTNPNGVAKSDVRPPNTTPPMLFDALCTENTRPDMVKRHCKKDMHTGLLVEPYDYDPSAFSNFRRWLLVKFNRRLAEKYEVSWRDRNRAIDAEDCDLELVTYLD
jgi:hypothetical protein